jgi:hypothetical protein
MMSMSDELKERNILKMILIVRFTCATLDVGHPILKESWGFCHRMILLWISVLRNNRIKSSVSPSHDHFAFNTETFLKLDEAAQI